MNIGKETEFIEFKQSTSELEESLIDISAMLNKHGRGVLYFGVKNNGDAIGFEIGEETKRDISRKIFEKIKPQIFPVIEEMSDLKIIKVTFEGTDRPYSAHGRYYIRVTDESREMTPDELAKMIMKTNYKDFEKQQSEDVIEDVDETQLKKFFRDASECERIEPMEYDKIKLLEKLKLLADDKKHLNNAGKLLFSTKEPLELKLAVFATNEKRTFLDLTLVKGNIFALMKESERYLKRNMHWGPEIKGFERKDVPEIPLEALREILNNAFAHADYTCWSKNEIDIFPNRIAIYNPGAFPDGLSPDDFANKTLSSKIRNELICNVLFRCKAVETWGTGILKAYRYCEKKNIKIRYEKESDGFWFIFCRPSALQTRNNPDTNRPNNPDTNKEKNKESNIYISLNEKLPNNPDTNRANNPDTNTLTELEMIILSEIEENMYISKDNIAKKYCRSDRTIQRGLDSLRRKQKIRRIGGRKGYWVIVEHK